MHAVYSIFYAADGVGEKSACLLHLAEEKQPDPAVAAVLRLPPGPGPGLRVLETTTANNHSRSPN
jgi:hypothetical protein